MTLRGPLSRPARRPAGPLPPAPTYAPAAGPAEDAVQADPGLRDGVGLALVGVPMDATVAASDAPEGTSDPLAVLAGGVVLAPCVPGRARYVTVKTARETRRLKATLSGAPARVVALEDVPVVERDGLEVEPSGPARLELVHPVPYSDVRINGRTPSADHLRINAAAPPEFPFGTVFTVLVEPGAVTLDWTEPTSVPEGVRPVPSRPGVLRRVALHVEPGEIMDLAPEDPRWVAVSTPAPTPSPTPPASGRPTASPTPAPTGSGAPGTGIDRAVGLVSVAVSPPGASVTLAGRPFDPGAARKVPVGRYALVVSAPGHESATRTVDVAAGADLRLSVTLAPSRRRAEPRSLAIAGLAIAAVGSAVWAALYSPEEKAAGSGAKAPVRPNPGPGLGYATLEAARTHARPSARGGEAGEPVQRDGEWYVPFFYGISRPSLPFGTAAELVGRSGHVRARGVAAVRRELGV